MKREQDGSDRSDQEPNWDLQVPRSSALGILGKCLSWQGLYDSIETSDEGEVLMAKVATSTSEECLEFVNWEI